MKAEAKRLDAIIGLTGGAGERIVVLEADANVPGMRLPEGRARLSRPTRYGTPASAARSPS